MEIDEVPPVSTVELPSQTVNIMETSPVHLDDENYDDIEILDIENGGVASMNKNTRYPVYHTAKLKRKEIMDICVSEKVNEKVVCTEYSSGSPTFVVDLMFVKAEDLTTDGLIYNTHTSPSERLSIKLDTNGSILSSEKYCKGNEGNQPTYLYKRQYSDCFSMQLQGLKLKIFFWRKLRI